jgi:hypothetical protein
MSFKLSNSRHGLRTPFLSSVGNYLSLEHTSLCHTIYCNKINMSEVNIYLFNLFISDNEHVLIKICDSEKTIFQF